MNLMGTPELLFAAVLVTVLFFLMRSGGRRRAKGPYRDRGRHPERSTSKRPKRDSGPVRAAKAIRPDRDRNWILVDGSNVMHWEDNTPHVEPLRRVVTALKAQGLDPGVVFDANAGWKLFGRYMGEGELSQIIGLPQDQVLVVPKGSPADPWLSDDRTRFRGADRHQRPLPRLGRGTPRGGKARLSGPRQPDGRDRLA